MVDQTFFKISGNVCKNVFHKNDPNGRWAMTNFLVGVYVGKDKQTNKSLYDNFPVTVWADVPVEQGDRVTVTGILRMTKPKGGEKPIPQLVADDKSGVAFSTKTSTMSATESAPSDDDGFFDNAQSEIGSTDGIPF